MKFFYNTWLKELTFFFWTYVQKLILVSMIHRIEPSLHDSKNWTFFFWKYDSENWTFCKYDWKNWTFFIMTQRMEPSFFFFEYDAKNWTLFCLNVTQRIEPFFFFEWDQKIWTFSEKNLTHRNWDLLFNMTHRNWEPFLKLWLKELNLFLF